MEPGARRWRPPEEQSFLQRLLHWLDILNPSLLLASDGEIKNSIILLDSVAEPGRDSTHDGKVKEAWNLNLCSVHPDTGNIIPVPFRPPALLLVAAPLFIFHLYSAGFNAANGNATSVEKAFPQKQALLCIGAVSFGACSGATPQILLSRYSLHKPALQTFFRSLLPVPLHTLLSAFNLAVVRATEVDNGIQVVDKDGSVIGVSKTAGAKAIKETAISRAALIGTTALLPNLVAWILKRTRFMQRNTFALAPVRVMTAALTFATMIPVSFSLFPRTGTIMRADLEEEIQSSTQQAELFYNRGL
ncbi:sideroflexin-4 isoform X2 [Rhinatrema bivittatum]|uniref:sideroflexin-4 isoform X2 n=1 Tax=Rhinatrema bivittatum TaxID=194408 RepID=UPI00112CCEF1|nr:sideroflexin-4 isoform X2 [Rhinatrema bivittatum]